MAPELNDVAVLVRVVDLGSFAKVARELDVPTSTVARAVARLEESLQTRLLLRSTRSLTPTSEGRAFYQDVAPAVAAIQRAARSAAATEGTPRGVLHIASSNDIGTWLVAPSVVKFSAAHPMVRVEMDLSARNVNLVEEGFDVAIRLGPLSDSSLVATKLINLQAGIYASPKYVEENGAPRALDELDKHTCILFRARDGVIDWALEGPEGPMKHRVQGRITCDDYSAVRAMVLEGAGVAWLPMMMTAEAVRANHLVRILPAYVSGSRPLYFLHESARNVAPKIDVFRELLFADVARRQVEWRMLDRARPPGGPLGK